MGLCGFCKFRAVPLQAPIGTVWVAKEAPKYLHGTKQGFHDSGKLSHISHTLRLPVYKWYLFWGLQSINSTYCVLFGGLRYILEHGTFRARV